MNCRSKPGNDDDGPAATVEPSYVLRALGLSDTLANASVRFGLGRFTTAEEVDFTIDAIAAAVARRSQGDGKGKRAYID